MNVGYNSQSQQSTQASTEISSIYSDFRSKPNTNYTWNIPSGPRMPPATSVLFRCMEAIYSPSDQA